MVRAVVSTRIAIGVIQYLGSRLPSMTTSLGGAIQLGNDMSLSVWSMYMIIAKLL